MESRAFENRVIIHGKPRLREQSCEVIHGKPRLREQSCEVIHGKPRLREQSCEVIHGKPRRDTSLLPSVPSASPQEGCRLSLCFFVVVLHLPPAAFRSKLDWLASSLFVLALHAVLSLRSQVWLG